MLDWVAGWAASRGIPTTDVFIRYACAVTTDTIVVGAETPAQLVQDLRAWQRPPLTVDELVELRSRIPCFAAEQLDPALWPPASRNSG